MKAFEIACRVCCSQPNEWCQGTWLLFHAERLEDAAACGGEGAPPTKDEFYKAIQSRF